LAQSLRIETLDRSGRWYLTPGSRSIYDLRVRNDAKDATDCSIIVEDPASGVTVDPPTFTLRGHEVRTVTVLFSERANPTRAQRVLMKLCDNAGAQLASFEHPLIVTGGTDCSVELAFKDVIMQDGELQGFALLATVHSQSEAPCAFALTMTPHPALSVPELPPVQLEPGSGADVVIPVRWDQSKKDESGRNHPTLLEIGVPVSNGKRTKRLRWDSFAQRLTAGKKPAGGKSQNAPPRAPSNRVPQPAALTPLLMLSGQMALKCLPNPAAAPANGAATNGVATIAKAEASAVEAMELPLFAAPQAEPPAKPSASASASAPPPVTAPKPQPAVSAPPAASAPPATPSQTPKIAAPPPASDARSSWAAVVTPAAALSEQAVPSKAAPTPSTPQVQASTNAAPQATLPTTAPAAASSAAPSSSQPAAPAAATPPPPPTQGPKLTPYTRARWNIEDNLAAAVVAPPPKASSSPPAPADEAAVATPARTTATVIRTRPVSSTPGKRGAPAGIIIGAAAIAAIAVAVFLFKPNSAPKPAQPVTSTTTAAVATQSAKVSTAVVLPASISSRHATIVVHAKRPAVSVTPATHATPAHATATPAPTAAPTTAAATPRPATPKPAAQKPAAVAAHHKAPAVVRPRPQPVQQLTQAVVALGQVEAYYGPRGRAVRVLWSSADQASASVQLIDDRGTIVSSTSVRGARQSAILYLPRRFHGGLTVQVSSVGRGGERVATTTSLPAYGN